MLNNDELEKEIKKIRAELEDALQLKKRIGTTFKNNTTLDLRRGKLQLSELDLNAGKLVIPVNSDITTAGDIGELRYNGTYVYVYSGTSWVALT